MDFCNQFSICNLSLIKPDIIKVVYENTNLPQVIIDIINSYDTGMRKPPLSIYKHDYKLQRSHTLTKYGCSRLFTISSKYNTLTIRGGTEDGKYEYTFRLEDSNGCTIPLKIKNLTPKELIFDIKNLPINTTFYLILEDYTIPRIILWKNVYN